MRTIYLGTLLALCSSPGLLFAEDADCCDTFFWASAEYLNWRIKDGPVAAPLVTTSTNANIGTTNFGILGFQDTVTLFGDGGIEYGNLNGARFSAGVQMGFGGLEVIGFKLFEQAVDTDLRSDLTGRPLVAIPFFDSQQNTENSFLLAFPDLFFGGVSIESHSELSGVEVNAVCGLTGNNCFGVELLAGVRAVRLNEDLTFNTDYSPVAGSGVTIDFNDLVGFGAGNVVRTFDTFETRNEFLGGQVGIRTEVRNGRFYLLTDAKVGLGRTRQSLNVRGQSTLTDPAGNVLTANGGFFALPTNIGRFTNHEFSVLPELAVNFGMDVSENLRVYVGYTFMYWTNVLRPGNQIDRIIDPRQLPVAPATFFDPTFNAQNPAPVQRDSDFWTQGLNVGLAIRF